ncbi:DUF6165 family protein [Marinimicrobium sp. C2-29]|uniref:DUF6165 family protein n=1 Tax=Marinimicrobium sp. C2-29 TaxID=3139825 RepID=UPI003138BB27
MLIEAPISLGELVDKITILEIKQVKISDPDKLHNVKHERDVLSQKLDQLLSDDDILKLEPLKKALKEINESLWVIEDDIRDCERDKEFGQLFIDLARSVYITNDRRAAVKKDINLAFGSELVEEKSYRDYQ